MSVVAEGVNNAFYRYGRFCASHALSLLLWSIFTFLLLCQPVLRLSFANTASFESALATYSDRGYLALDKSRNLSASFPVAGYVLQVIVTLKHDTPAGNHHNPASMRHRPAVAEDVRGASEEILRVLRTTKASRIRDDTGNLPNELKPDKRQSQNPRQPRQTPVGVGKASQQNERENSSNEISLQEYCQPLLFNQDPITKMPDCLLIDLSLFSESDLNEVLERPTWLSGYRGLASLATSLSVKDVSIKIVFDRLKRFSRDPQNFQDQFSVGLIFRDAPPIEVIENLCTNLQGHFGKTGVVCVKIDTSNSQGPGGSSPDLTTKSKSVRNSAAILYKSTKRLRRAMFSVPLSYALLCLYVYFTVSKISMVRSKWGLALAAVMTVFMSLIAAAGICVHFNFIPTIWVAEYFPYLAMMVGLENSLCVTQSVVSIPVRLSPKDRLAHGLSLEGWSLVRNFLIHMVIIVIGCLTFVPDIQEFCFFGIIGFFADFSMQLFFYAPCLYFDLIRVNPEMLEQLRCHQLTMQPVNLPNYPSGKCPVVQRFPILGALRESLARFLVPKRIKRYRSESTLNTVKPDRRGRRNRPVTPIDDAAVSFLQTLTVDPTKKISDQVRRRTRSSARNDDSPTTSGSAPTTPDFTVSRRFRLLHFWTTNRLLTKFMMLLVCSWILWLALFVHKFQELNTIAHGFEKRSCSISDISCIICAGTESYKLRFRVICMGKHMRGEQIKALLLSGM